MITVRQTFFRILDESTATHYFLEKHKYIPICDRCNGAGVGLLDACPLIGLTHEEVCLVEKIFLDKTEVVKEYVQYLFVNKQKHKGITIQEYNEVARRLNDMILDGVLVDLDIL